MNVYITESQSDLIIKAYKENKGDIEKFMTWSGLDLVDKYVGENNNAFHPDDLGTDELDKLNEIYCEVQMKLEKIWR
tara:strand:- start:5664 stop:5894 length:231 start_codon:yes stop_codon:yes gene_type:complete